MNLSRAGWWESLKHHAMIVYNVGRGVPEHNSIWPSITPQLLARRIDTSLGPFLRLVRTFNSLHGLVVIMSIFVQHLDHWSWIFHDIFNCVGGGGGGGGQYFLQTVCYESVHVQNGLHLLEFVVTSYIDLRLLPTYSPSVASIILS